MANFYGQYVGFGAGGVSGTAFSVQGSNYGYSLLGTYGDRIDRFAFASDGDATDVGGKSSGRTNTRGVSGTSSATHGFACGGNSAEDTIDKFAFASEGTMSDVGSLENGRFCQDEGNQSGDNGYQGGGDASGATDFIDKFSHVSDGNGSDIGNLTRLTRYSSGQSSATHGFTSCGHPAQNEIDKYAFASDGDAVDHGDLATAVYGSGGCASVDYGYCFGGNTSVAYRAGIEKFAFASGGGSEIGVCTGNAYVSCGVASTTHGYRAGGIKLGGPGQVIDVIDKWTTASDNDATDVGNLTGYESDAGGVQY